MDRYLLAKLFLAHLLLAGVVYSQNETLVQIGSGHTEGILPEDTTALPEDTTALPEDTTALPEDTTAPTEDTTTLPEDTTALPEDTTALPEDTTALPDGTTALPEDTTTPTEDTTAPTEDTTAPPEDTTTPTEDTITLPDDTTAQTEDTTTPTEDTTTLPEDITTPPEDTTTLPEDTTAPTEDTTAPTEDTTAPTEDTTTLPEDTTALPTDAPTENTLTFDITCDPNVISQCNSPTLDEIASNATPSIAIIINIRTDSLKLENTAHFTNLRSVTLRGNNSAITCRYAGVGLEFFSAGNINIDSVVITRCGSTLELTQRNTSIVSRVRSAVHIDRCQRLTMTNVAISHSNGSGLSVQRPEGYVNVRRCNFTDNTMQGGVNEEVQVLGGNGVILYISTSTQQRDYRFINCRFIHNVANSVTFDFILSTPNGDRRERGRGGGMLVTVNERSVRQRVHIINSHFEENGAFLGAGLSAAIEGGGTGNLLRIRNSIFTRNGCQGVPGVGGGVYLSFEGLSKFDDHQTNYSMFIEHVRFQSNCAHLGGGAYFFSDRSDKSNSNNKILFDNSTWSNNRANTGSAVDLGPNVFKRAAMGFLPTPEFRDCMFFHNIIGNYNESANNTTGQAHGSGTLHSSLISIAFTSSVTFVENNGSAIIIVNGVANFENSNANFTGNYGTQGGAIYLIGTSSMTIGPGHEYYFIRNKALDRGGAIYSYLVDDTDFVVSRSCFIQYMDPDCKGCLTPSTKWEAVLTFDRNEAKIGHSIYATSVIPCQVVTGNSSGTSRYRTISARDIFKSPGVEMVEDGRIHNIATEASQFQTQGSAHDTLKAIPGQTVKLGIQLLDDLRNEVGGTLTAYVRDDYMRDDKIEIDSDFSCITNHQVKLSGKVGASGEIALQTIGSRKISLTRRVELQPCPPAFRLSSNNKCMCAASAYVGIEKCSDDFTAFMTQGFWAGYIIFHDNHTGHSESELATSICPVGFCRYNGTDSSMGIVELPSNKSLLGEAICDGNRNGTLCGKCMQGFTTHYHSRNLDCLEAKPVGCKLGWLFYILSELVPVTLLFIFVLALNINFNTGAVNGFILFSQLLDTMFIDASGVIQFNDTITTLSRGYHIIYGFFNLDFFSIKGLSYCLWQDATPLGMLTFKYVTIVYALILVLSVILFMRYSAAKCCGRYYSITALRNSVIHGLSGFLVLCYSQCVKVSFSILYNQELTTAHTHYHRKELNRVFFNGNLIYLSSEHLPHAIPAIVVLMFIGVIPPLVLFALPLLNRLVALLKMEKSRFARLLNHTNRLKPLLDSFQGCFKDNYRFFAGIYFLYRWPAVITYALFFQLSLFYTVLQVLLILMLVVHSVCQPYEKRWHNILDTLLLTNLVIINGITTLLYYWIRVDVGRDSLQITRRTTILGSIQLVLIYLPLLYIAVYVVGCILRKTMCKGVSEKPVEEDFVLKKLGKRLYRLSTDGVENFDDCEEPYRLMNKEEEDPFSRTTSVDADDDDTPRDTYF